MLDKRTARFLSILAKICDDGSYKIIEKTELAKQMFSRNADYNVLEQLIRYLSDNEMIDVKYTDETVYCLSVLPKGRVAYESMRSSRRELIRIDKKTLIILFTGVFIASIIGAMIGALFAKLM